MTTKQEIIEALNGEKTRSAWARGVKTYAVDLVNDCEGDEISEKALLNGAETWRQYSEGGCALIYDADIAERVCAPWELNRTDGGRRQPSSRENWIDVQSRALFQAWRLIRSVL